MDSEERKSFTIKGARLADIAAFNTFKDNKGYTQGKVFEELIAGRFTENAPAVTTPEVNTNESEFTKRIAELEQENQRLADVNRQLTLREEELVNENSTLKSNIDEIKAGANKLLLEMDGMIRLDETDILVKPSEELAKALKKIGPRLRYDKVVKPGERYPSAFLATATESYLKDKYSEAFE